MLSFYLLIKELNIVNMQSGHLCVKILMGSDRHIKSYFMSMECSKENGLDDIRALSPEICT